MSVYKISLVLKTTFGQEANTEDRKSLIDRQNIESIIKHSLSVCRPQDVTLYGRVITEDRSKGVYAAQTMVKTSLDIDAVKQLTFSCMTAELPQYQG